MRRAVTGVVLTVLLAPAGTALAHKGSPNYESTVRGVAPEVGGVAAEVLNRDDRLVLTNRSQSTIVIEGYNDEPYARLRPDGTVEVNRRSPAYFLNQDRLAQTKVPASATASAAPQWQELDRTGRFEWHDHRMHWMGKGTPPAVKDEAVRTKVFDWSVPIRAGDRPGRITGTLTWIPSAGGGVPAITYLLVAVLVLGALALLVVVQRRRRGEPAEAW